MDSKKEDNASGEAAARPSPQSGEEEEGGFWGWAAVVGAFLVNFSGFGFSTSFGVYQDYYTRMYLTNTSPSAISWIGSINACLVTAAGLVVGRLYDRGYFQHLMIGGSLLITFSLFMLSLCQQDHYYQIFLTQGLGAGIGAGIMYVPSLALISQHFKKRRAIAMGLVASGSSLGAVVHPIVVNNTLNSSLGFGNATRIEAAMVAVCLIVACLLMREKKQSHRPTQQKLGANLKKFAKDKTYLAGIFASPIYFMGYYFPIFYLQLDSVAHGLNKNFAFYALVILSASSFIGRILAGFIAHKMDAAKAMTVTTACSSIVIFGMIGLKSLASVVVIAILYGFFAGMYIALLAPLYVILSDDMSELGMRMGIGIAMSGLGVLVGPPIMGALLGDPYVWWRPALWAGMTSGGGAATYALMTYFLYRKKRAQKAEAEAAAAAEEMKSGGASETATMVENPKQEKV